MIRIARILVAVFGAKRMVQMVDAVMVVMHNNAVHFATYLMSHGYRGEGFQKVKRRIERTETIRRMCRLILTDRHNEFKLWVENHVNNKNIGQR